MAYFTMIVGTQTRELGTFSMAALSPGEDPDDPVPYTKKDRTRNLPKPGAKVRELYSTRRIQVVNRLIYHTDP